MSDFNQSQKRRRSRRIEEKKIMENLEANNNSLINKLHDDCLQHIFSFLSISEKLEAEKVCKRWHIISKRGWNDIKKLTIYREYSDNTVYLILKRCGRFLRELTIYGSREHSHSLSMIIKFCKLDLLEDIKIDLWGEERKDKCFIRNLREIFERTRKLAAAKIAGYEILNSIDYINLLNPGTLQKLCLENSFSRFDSTRRLSINPDIFPNLRELDLSEIKIFGDETKREEANLKGLEILVLSGCVIPQNFLQRIATFVNLQELFLNGNYCDLNDRHIRDIAEHCNKLKDVSIVGSSNLTSDCFQYLGKMLSLEILRFDDFENARSGDFMYLANVKHFTFTFDAYTDHCDAVIGLISNSPNLEKLLLSFSYDVDVDVTFVRDVEQFFHRGQRKKPLHLSIICIEEVLPPDMWVESDHPLLTVDYDCY